MIKNNNSQVNPTHNLVKKASVLKFGYRLVVAATLATTIQSCNNHGAYLNLKDGPREAFLQSLAEAERLANEKEAARRLADEARARRLAEAVFVEIGAETPTRLIRERLNDIGSRMPRWTE